MFSYSDQYVGIAAIASFLFGYQIAVLNTSLVFFTLRFGACGNSYTYNCPAATTWESLVLAMVFIGATIGSLTGGKLVARGRHFTLLIAHVISLIGAAVCFYAHNFPTLLAGRCINGFCVGLITVASPSLISEMCPAKIRGSRATMHQLAVTVGILAAVGIGLFLTQPPLHSDSSYSLPNFEHGWIRFMQALPGVVSAIALLLMLFLYRDETPQALLARGRTSAATKVLAKIYDDPIEAEEYLHQLTESMDEDRDSSTKRGLLDVIRRPGYVEAIVVGCILSIGQQAGGINAFVAQSTKIFQTSGMPPALTAQVSTIMAVVNVIMTFPPIFVIDSLGRRPLLMIGLLGQAICLSITPIVSLTGYSAAYAAAFSVIGFVIFFALAYGPVLWVYLFEIYPPDIKGYATGIASALNWITGCLVVYINRISAEEYNIWNFVIFGATCWFMFVFVALFLRETKGSTVSPYIPFESEDERLPLKA